MKLERFNIFTMVKSWKHLAVQVAQSLTKYR